MCVCVSHLEVPTEGKVHDDIAELGVLEAVLGVHEEIVVERAQHVPLCKELRGHLAPHGDLLAHDLHRIHGSLIAAWGAVLGHGLHFPEPAPPHDTIRVKVGQVDLDGIGGFSGGAPADSLDMQERSRKRILEGVCCGARGDVCCVVGSCRESQVSAFGTRKKKWGLRSRRVEAPTWGNEAGVGKDGRRKIGLKAMRRGEGFGVGVGCGNRAG